MGSTHITSRSLPRIIVGTLTTLLIAWSALLALNTSIDSGAAGSAPTATATQAEHANHPGGSSEPVSQRLAADPEGVRYCASAALEPFAAAMQQLAATGPSDATDRFRACLVETLMYHVSDAELAELAGHLPHFDQCFGAMQPTSSSAKDAVLPELTACLAAAN